MRNVLLTGASGDIGKAINDEFIKHEDNVISPTHTEMDLSSMESVNSYMKKLKSGVDVFVHCAAINFPKPIENISFEDLYQTMCINTFSFYQIVKFLLENFKNRKNGYILGVSSIYGSIARKGRFSYVSSKHCLSGMIKSLALEYGKYGVKCNTLSPGFVDTKLTRQNNDEATIKSFANKVPLGKLASVNDIAEIAYFLCSDHNKYINGQNIIADGGYTTGGFQE
jgi:NAD(P)-dependent dehydrogenase (short-subunit alcohol dehydrogenase family)